MKRITVSLPDELVEKVRAAAGGQGQVSSYVSPRQVGLARLLASSDVEVALLTLGTARVVGATLTLFRV